MKPPGPPWDGCLYLLFGSCFIFGDEDSVKMGHRNGPRWGEILHSAFGMTTDASRKGLCLSCSPLALKSHKSHFTSSLLNPFSIGITVWKMCNGEAGQTSQALEAGASAGLRDAGQSLALPLLGEVQGTTGDSRGRDKHSAYKAFPTLRLPESPRSLAQIVRVLSAA